MKKEIDISFQDSVLKIFAEQLMLDNPVIVKKGNWGQGFIFHFLNDPEQHCLLLLLSEENSSGFMIEEVLVPGVCIDVILVGMLSKKNPGNCFSNKKKILRQFLDLDYNQDRNFAVYPHPVTPKIVFDYKKKLLSYVELISWLSYSNPFKIFIKKIILSITGLGYWKGWTISVLVKGRYRPAYPSASDFYMFLTPDRQISLIFNDRQHLPFFVIKKGKTVSLQKERENHQWAIKKLGDKVPQIQDGSLQGHHTSEFQLEYIRERDIIGTISHTFFQKKQFMIEAVELIRFFETTGIGLIDNKKHNRYLLKDSLKQTVLSGLDFFKQKKCDAALMHQLMNSVHEKSFVLIPQHCDFCTRNILYGTNNRKVLIDWEDFELKMFPLVDLYMLLMSLEEASSKFHKNGGNLFWDNPAVNRQIKATASKIRLILEIDHQEWKECFFLSMAYLTGNNLQKKRPAVAEKIRNNFFSNTIAVQIFDTQGMVK